MTMSDREPGTRILGRSVSIACGDNATALSAGPRYRWRLAGQRLGLWCIVLGFLQLNAQVVLVSFFDAKANATSDARVLTWLLFPAVLWVLLLVRGLRLRSKVLVDKLCATWIWLILAHAVASGIAGGVVASAAAFLAWGCWVSLFAWGSKIRGIDFGRFVCWLFFFAGVVNAIPVLYEMATASAIFQTSTVGLLVRYYGISQSLNLLGMQLGLGSLAALWILRAGNAWVRLGCIIGIAVQVVALVSTATRGPLLFSTIAMLAMIGMGRGRLKSTILVVVLLLLSAVGLFWPSENSQDFVDHILQGFSLGDEGNQARIAIYRDTVEQTLKFRPLRVWFGHGSGAGSLLARMAGREEIGVESSLIAMWYDLGLVGLALFLSLVAVGTVRAAGTLGGPGRESSVILLAMLLALALQISIHETLKAWLGAFYLWAVLAALEQRSRASLASR